MAEPKADSIIELTGTVTARMSEPPPPWNWERWLHVGNASLAPTPLFLFVRDRFDALEAVLRRLADAEHVDDDDVREDARALLSELDAAKAG